MLSRPELPQVTKDMLGIADVLQLRGHCKGMLTDKDGRVCAMGAIAAFYEGQYNPRAAKVLHHVKNALDGSLDSIVKWNDAPERTAQEVIDLFRTTAYNLALVKV